MQCNRLFSYLKHRAPGARADDEAVGDDIRSQGMERHVREQPEGAAALPVLLLYYIILH